MRQTQRIDDILSKLELHEIKILKQVHIIERFSQLEDRIIVFSLGLTWIVSLPILYLFKLAFCATLFKLHMKNQWIYSKMVTYAERENAMPSFDRCKASTASLLTFHCR